MNPDLSQLRDIHLPVPVSWWPPAPGWWLLAVLVPVIVLGMYIMVRRRQRNAWRRSALIELTQLRQQYQSQPSTPQIIVNGLSVLLRRVAISYYPREEVAMLSGDKWLAFLERSMGAPFKPEHRHLLTVAPYAPDASIPPDAMLELFTLCESWITKLPDRGNK